MKERLQVAIASLAVLIGFGSMGVSAWVGAQTHHEVCGVKIESNAHTRKFLSDLLADPTVPAAERAQVTALALKDFPANPCT